MKPTPRQEGGGLGTLKHVLQIAQATATSCHKEGWGLGTLTHMLPCATATSCRQEGGGLEP